MKWANCMNHLWAEMMSKLWFQLTEHCAVSCCMEINNSDAVRKSSTENFMCWWKQKHVSYYRWKGSHTSSMIRCIDNKQIQKKNEIGTPNSKLLLSLMVKARKRSELNPDPYTFNVNNCWCSALPYQRFAGDIIKSKKIMQARIRTSASVLGSLQTISSFKSFGRGQEVFLFICFFLHFSLLTWLNSRSSRKPIKREACIHDISLGSFHIYGFLCHDSEDVPWT